MSLNDLLLANLVFFKSLYFAQIIFETWNKPFIRGTIAKFYIILGQPPKSQFIRPINITSLPSYDKGSCVP